jgi:hypothetical protein
VIGRYSSLFTGSIKVMSLGAPWTLSVMDVLKNAPPLQPERVRHFEPKSRVTYGP